MNIQPFQLPSDPEKTIYLREATVEDCEYFAETDSDSEEAMTNEVLELLQCKPDKYIDPKTWSNDDRKLAAFWYYTATIEDKTIYSPYECPHCGEEHHSLIDLEEIGAKYQPLTGRPYREIEHEGEKFRVVPRNGYLMTELEQIRLQLTGVGDDKHLTVIDRHDLVGTIIREGCSLPRDRRIESVEKYVRGLTLSSYKALKEKRDNALNSMRHGLPTGIHEGKSILWAETQCENRKGDASASVRLRLPFRLGEMLPRIL